MRVITWMDLTAQFRITSPAYGHLMRKYSVRDDEGVVIRPFTEQDTIDLVWERLVAKGGYGIALDHPKETPDGEALAAKIITLGGADRELWRMDVDGTPRLGV